MTLEDATRELELRDARIHRLVYALDGLERMTSRRGGYMTMDEQAVLGDAKEALAIEGVHRKPAGKVWVDR